MPTLTVTDVQGAATADFTIAGAGAAEPWTAYLAKWAATSIGFWASTATGVGNQTVNAAITPGYYLAYAREDSGAWVADPVYVRLTGAVAKAVWLQILEAVQATIQGLALPDTTAENVTLRKIPWHRGQTLTEPRIIVSPFPDTRDHLAGSNLLDETRYGALVTIARAGNQNLTEDIDVHLLTRQIVTRAFVNGQLASVVEVERNEVEPFTGPYPDGAFANNLDVQGLVIRCITREPRDLV